MEYQKYMTNTYKIERYLGKNEDTHMPMYGNEESIKCFVYGKNIFIRENTSSATVSAKAYITTEPVYVGDKLDGQVVKSVDEIPEFDGTVPLYECLTWYD